MTRVFLVVYDYGQGGIWAFVRAKSVDEIQTAFPELQVVPERPSWMTPEIELAIRESRTVDIDQRDKGFLADILRERSQK